jgi:hypothetical protein
MQKPQKTENWQLHRHLRRLMVQRELYNAQPLQELGHRAILDLRGRGGPALGFLFVFFRVLKTP